MGESTDLLSLFGEYLEHLTVDDWKRVYDARPLGYGTGNLIPLTSRDHYHWRTQAPIDEKDRLTTLLEQTLGGAESAEKLGGGRVNFLSYCMDRLFKAVDAIGNRKVLSPEGFVAGYGAFLQVIPPAAVGITDEIAELWDPTVRTPLLERYADLLKSLHGRDTAADALLTDDGDRIGLAICLESVAASEARRTELEEMYVALCAFPRVAASAPTNEADPVRACENARLRWLGYDARLPEGDRLTIGAGVVRSVANESGVLTVLMMIGGFLPMAGVVVAALIASGGRLDTLGLIGAAFVGMSGVAAGVPVYLKLSARAKYGSVQRKVALAISIVVIVVVAAASGYLYIRFITR